MTHREGSYTYTARSGLDTMQARDGPTPPPVRWQGYPSVSERLVRRLGAAWVVSYDAPMAVWHVAHPASGYYAEVRGLARLSEDQCAALAGALHTFMASAPPPPPVPGGRIIPHETLERLAGRSLQEEG